jgi:hypothetical protein
MMRLHRTISTLALAAMLAGVMIALVSCKRAAAPTYSQASPDDTLRTLIQMVRNGDADQIPPKLIYADKPELRAILKRMGELTGSLQALAKELNTRFPNEVAQLKAAATDGASLQLDDLFSASGKGLNPDDLRKKMEAKAKAAAANAQRQADGKAPITTPPPAPNEPELMFRNLATRLVADPFGWISEHEAKLTTVKLADDQAAVLYDGKPVPPIGVTMKLDKGQWYFVLPLNAPGVGQFIPQTRHEWSIIGSLIKVLDNAVKDVTDEVRSGKVRTMNKLAESIGEKAFIPGAIVFVVYGKEMDVRTKRERAAKQFSRALNTWATNRTGDDAAIIKKLTDALNRLALEELDTLVRASVKDNAAPLPAFEKMDETALTSTIENWLKPKGIALSLNGVFSASEAEAAIAKIDAWLKGKRDRR